MIILASLLVTVIVSTFTLDLAAVNARATLEYNKVNHDDTRRVFLRKLMILYIKKRAKVKNLKSVTISTLSNVLVSCTEVVLPDIETMTINLMIKMENATFPLKAYVAWRIKTSTKTKPKQNEKKNQ